MTSLIRVRFDQMKLLLWKNLRTTLIVYGYGFEALIFLTCNKNNLITIRITASH